MPRRVIRNPKERGFSQENIFKVCMIDEPELEFLDGPGRNQQPSMGLRVKIFSG